MEINSYGERVIPAKSVIRLYQNVGWWEDMKESEIEDILERTISVGAWIDDELVGFARAVSDGKFRAYVEDVVVHHQYRRKEIGTHIIERLLHELEHIDIISLFCDETLIPFYEIEGFRSSSSQYVLHRTKK
ncbi:GNAT family N-acetyltransferase [Pontibacillus marinus]|uniref:GNAT family acetyltransferase n=1 Tax=Pontibacillus marinus BH030004 = DSM 16465 TaxID=1385511 RepID=A0A0A5GAS1_9BACI|nr:GNAT family N-acetyltransferase [Pontibacillus marinus]KGX88293.1 GNAT family acetyltransferase [Pontibacillus marinus BH030004 = DSM 16465]